MFRQNSEEKSDLSFPDISDGQVDRPSSGDLMKNRKVGTIKSPKEGRLVRPKDRENSSRFSLCCFVIYVYIFVWDKTAGFGYRHFI